MGVTDRQEVWVRKRKKLSHNQNFQSHSACAPSHGFHVKTSGSPGCHHVNKRHPTPQTHHRLRPRRQPKMSSCVCCQLDESRHQRRVGGIISAQHLHWTRPDGRGKGRKTKRTADYSLVNQCQLMLVNATTKCY